MKKLAMIPPSWGQNGRKMMLSQDGTALTLLDHPPRLFWTYDDQGEYDPRLIIDVASFIPRPYCVNVGRINIGGPPCYTGDPELETVGRFYAYLATYDSEDPVLTRGMTFWVYGMKIHFTAIQNPTGLDSLFARVTGEWIPSLNKSRITVNGIDRGLWPPMA